MEKGKSNYESPEVEVILFELSDIVTASFGDEYDDGGWDEI